LRLWNTKVGVPDQSYYLHLAMQVKIVSSAAVVSRRSNFELIQFFGFILP
jgi:hypothetical protein